MDGEESEQTCSQKFEKPTKACKKPTKKFEQVFAKRAERRNIQIPYYSKEKCFEQEKAAEKPKESLSKHQLLYKSPEIVDFLIAQKKKCPEWSLAKTKQLCRLTGLDRRIIHKWSWDYDRKNTFKCYNTWIEKVTHKLHNQPN